MRGRVVKLWSFLNSKGSFTWVETKISFSNKQWNIFALFYYYNNKIYLVILYESLPTWTGRITERQDTCGIIALSINLLDHSHPVIWQISSLPYDCCACLSVPKPLGGLIVFAANSLIYLDQSVPPYGISLNNLTNGSTQFSLKELKVGWPSSNKFLGLRHFFWLTVIWPFLEPLTPKGEVHS